MKHRSQRTGIAAITAIVATAGLTLVPGAPAAAVQVGPDDFRISQMGPDGSAGYEAQQSKIAYDPVNQRYLVVWRGDDEGDGQAEIYGQLIDARTGAATGPDDFVIARIGPVGQAGTDAIEPAVVWSSLSQEFVVVYSGDEDNTDSGPIISDTFEIYAQRVTASGAAAGSRLRVSDMGASDSSASYDANFADIAFDPIHQLFLVVWQGDDDTAPLVNNETEIYGQLLAYSSGQLVQAGDNDFRISTVGTDGVPATDGRAPAVAFNSFLGNYYVAWESNNDSANPGVFEVRGTIVSPSGVVSNTTGTVLNTIAASDEELQPDIAANPSTGEFAVVWMGDNGSDEFEIYRQLVGSTGALVGTTAAVSAAGPAGSTAYVANTPAIAFDSLQQQYVVVWSGDDSSLGTVDDEYEVFLRRLSSAGTAVGAAARVSTMGADGVANSSTSLPDVAFSDNSLGAAGTVWNAENAPTTGTDEGEIWGQFDAPAGDLSVTITVLSDTSPAPGDPVSYRIDWANQSSTTISGVTLESSVGALFDDPVGVPGPDVAGPPMQWLLGTLGAGDSGSITVSGTVSNTGENGDAVTFDASIASGSLIVDTDATDDDDSGSVTVDTPPSVTIDQAIGQADPTNDSSIDFTVSFSEPVTGFTAAGVDLDSSTVGGTPVAAVSGSGADYTVSVTGMNGVGDVIASITANAATDLDGAPDGNVASTSTDNTVTFDNVAPTVTIDQASGQADPTNGAPVQFTVVFSEAVSGFTPADINLASSTVGGALAASVSGSGPTYTVSVTGMAGVGTVVASIDAGDVTDLAGNDNAASTSTDNTVTFDNVAPTVTINQASTQVDPTKATPIEFTVVFSEAVSGFAGGDVDLSGSTVGGSLVASVSGSGPAYAVSVTGMSGSGTVVASIAAGAASDLAGNGNAASTSTDNTVTFDNVAPTVTINQASGQADPTNGASIDFTVVFSEAVTGFIAADVDLTSSTVGGSLAAVVSGVGPTYTVSVSGMSGSGTVVASIGAGAAADTATNASAASTSTDNTVTFDSVSPTVTINQASGQSDPTNGSVAFTVVFSEPVMGFIGSDVDLSASTVGGSLVASVSGSGPTYTVTVTGMAGTGTVVASIGALAVTDLAGNSSTASTSTDNTVTFDGVAPTVTINQAGGQVDPTNASPVVFTVVFSEAVAGFTGADISFTGSTVGGSPVASVTGAGPTYTVSVTGMSGAGTVVASLNAGVVADLAGNANTASTSTDNTVVFDNVAPTVTINQAAAQDDPTNLGPIVFTVTFSEPVTGFSAVDVSLAGSTVGGALTVVVSGAGASYTVSVSGMSGFGNVVASITAGAATDAATNGSVASTSTDNTVGFVPGDPNPGVNDAPVLTAPATAAAQLGVPVMFTGGNAISVLDLDAFGSDVQVTVTATDGVVVLPTGIAATVTGSGTASATITGSQTAVNSALASMIVIFSEVGSKAVAVAANDLGHSPAPAMADSATIAVTVTDTTPPVITVPSATVQATTDPGQPGAIVTYVVTVSDLGSSSATLTQAAPPTLACTPSSGSFFPIGTTTVNCTATDSVGNTSSASFAVQVVDDENPTITPPATVRVTLPAGASSGIVTYPVPTVGDNSGSATVTCAPASGSTFLAGNTTVTCTATDPSGNTATATFLVQVVSSALPATGGGAGLVPLATAALFAGLALMIVTRRRRVSVG